jgi:hypothetical protein
MALDRRQFICTSFDLALFAAMASAGVATPALASPARPGRLTLFDGRFPAAREAALAWANGSPTRAVGSDITDAVLELSALMHRATSCQIAGVTTEQVPFCLQQLAGNPRQTRLTLRRLSRDLFEWTLTKEGTNA